jgi:hypothetical protein
MLRNLYARCFSGHKESYAKLAIKNERQNRGERNEFFRFGGYNIYLHDRRFYYRNSLRERTMNEPSELDIAQLKHEMRDLYKAVGRTEALQVLFELLVGANAMAEVIVEETAKEGAK